MNSLRISIVFACSGVTLCIPLAGVAQAPVAPPMPTSATQQPFSARPDGSPDIASRLEGRLFFSAQERQRIDEARKRKLILNDDGQFVEAPPSVLNGFIKRSDGSTAVWVNGNVRWNATSNNAGSLVPGDVGGPAEYLKATIGEPMAPSPKPSLRAKKVLKPRTAAITTSKPRRFP